MDNGVVARLKTGKGVLGSGKSRFPLETLWQGGWLLVATVLSGGLAFLANLAVGRLLPPTDYSVYASMLSLTLIFGAVMAVLETVTTNHVAQLRAADQTQDVGALLLYLLQRLLPWGIGMAGIIWLFSRPLANLLRLPSSTPVWTMGTVLMPIAVLPVLQGGLRGLERFGGFGLNLIVQQASRLVTGAAFILLGWGAAGAVASLPLSYCGAVLLGLAWLASVLRSRNRAFEPELSNILDYAVYVAVGLVAFTAVMYMDTVIVKSRFPAREAGLYAAVATTGKVTLYLPAAVATLLLPKVTIRNAQNGNTVAMLRKSLLAVGGLCAAVTLVFFLFPSPIMQLLFGPGYLAHADLLGPYGLAMTLYALCNIWLAYYLALKRQGYSYALLCVALVQAVALFVLPLGLLQIVTALIVAGLVLNMLGGLLLITNRRPGSCP